MRRVLAPIALLAAGVVLLFVVFTSDGGSYTLRASFEDVRGLIPGAPVRAGAVTVGVVDSVDLVDDKPVATMTIDSIFKLREGATADIQLFSNAGAVNRTVELTLGDPTAPELEDGTLLAGEETDQPVNFDDAAETLNPPTRANLRQLLKGLDDSLKGRGKDFDETLRYSPLAVNEVGNLLAQVNSDGEALETLITEGSKVTTSLASSPGDLASAADTTAALLDVTTGRQADLGLSIQRLAPALRTGRSALDELTATTPRLRELVANLGPVADSLGPFARALPPALEAGGPFLDQARKLVEEGPESIREVAPVISAARDVAPELADLVDEVLPLGNALRAYIPDTVGFFQNLGSSLGSYDANGHVLSISGGIFQTAPASITDNEVGPDDCGPGALRAPFIRSPGALECEPWPDYEDSAVLTGDDEDAVDDEDEDE